MSVIRCFLAMLLVASGAAQAVEFDASIKAPKAVTGAELRNRIVSVKERIGNPVATDALASVRDRTLAKDRFDARYLLGIMVDARAPLAELEELGLKPRGDGGYTVDTRAHPEWQSMIERLLLLGEPGFVNGLESTLMTRGFHPSDYVALRSYVDTHDLGKARGQQKLALAISASRMAKKLQKLKRLDDDFMASYFYQKELRWFEAEQQWSVELLDALEPRAQRVLVSYLSELDSSTTIIPTRTADARKYERELLLKPDFEQQATTAFKEGRL